MTFMFYSSRSVRLLALLGLAHLLAAACSADGARGTDEKPKKQPLLSGPLYAVSSNLISPDFSSTTSLLWLVDDLESGEVRKKDGIELPGGASIWGSPKADTLFVASAEELTLTKYTVTRGKLEAVDKLGFTGEGITRMLGEELVFDGPDRGFFFDLNTAQALELDLSAMAIIGRIDVSDALLDSEQSFLGEAGFRPHGSRLVTSVYGTSANYDVAAPKSKLLFFDPKTAQIEVKDTPCGGLVGSVLAPNGDVYFAADTYIASVGFIAPESAPAPCLVRLPKDKNELEDRTIALNELTSGPTGGLIPGPDGLAFVRVLDTNAYSPTADSIYLEAFSAPVWQTWSIDLSKPSSSQRIDRPLLAGGIKFFEVDGQAYENESTADFGSTTLVRTTSDDAPRAGLVMPGVVWGIVRLH